MKKLNSLLANAGSILALVAAFLELGIDLQSLLRELKARPEHVSLVQSVAKGKLSLITKDGALDPDSRSHLIGSIEKRKMQRVTRPKKQRSSVAHL